MAKVETRNQENLTREGTTQTVDIKGKIVEFAFWMQKQGYKESTIQGRMVRLDALMKRGAILSDPESVKKTIALQRTWSDGTKANVVDAYSCFLEKEGLTWNPPRYTRLETIPFIPSEAELNQLIGSCGKVLSTFFFSRTQGDRSGPWGTCGNHGQGHKQRSKNHNDQSSGKRTQTTHSNCIGRTDKKT